MSWGKLDRVDRWKIIVAGAAGGVAAAYVMNEFQSLLKKTEKKLSPTDNEDDGGASNPGDNATVKAAQSIANVVGAGEIPEEQKESAGNAVHYGFGAIAGAVYGAFASEFPVVTSGFGTAYGGAVWLLGDETAVPALGFGPSPAESPLETHANALAAHCVYGFVTDLVMRSIVKKVWPAKG